MLDDVLLALLQTLRNGDYRFTTVTPATHQPVIQRPDVAMATDLRGMFWWSRAFEPQILPSHLFESLRETGVIEQRDDGWCSRLRVSSLGALLWLHSARPTDAEDAVFFGPDSYRFAAAMPRLSPGGSLLLYTGVAMPDEDDPFLAALCARAALADVDWDYRELDPDVFGEELELDPYLRVERIAAVALTATRPRDVS